MTNDKNSPREFWIVNDWEDCMFVFGMTADSLKSDFGNEKIHVIEFKAYEAAQAKIAELEKAYEDMYAYNARLLNDPSMKRERESQAKIAELEKIVSKFGIHNDLTAQTIIDFQQNKLREVQNSEKKLQEAVNVLREGLKVINTQVVQSVQSAHYAGYDHKQVALKAISEADAILGQGEK